jgi:NADH-quinone oxidoreductase subunit N
VALPALAGHWQPAIAVLAVVSMVGGNLGALAQGNVKRMLAYSSVAHAGYILSALVAAPRSAVEAVLFYLIAYAAVNLGGFGALAALAKGGREPLSLDDLAGLARRRPALAATLTVFLISLTGVPVSAGFVGKFYLFRAAVNADFALLAIVGVLMSVVSAYYYLRVVVVMYMREPVGEDAWAPVGMGSRLALAAAAGVVLVFGVYPGPALELARAAASSIPGRADRGRVRPSRLDAPSPAGDSGRLKAQPHAGTQRRHRAHQAAGRGHGGPQPVAHPGREPPANPRVAAAGVPAP